MGDRYLTDLAHVARSAGLIVLEVDGWQTRARSSGGYTSGRPDHVMCHHTASGPDADGWPDVDYIATGSDIAPIANLYLSRDGTVWVIAAGATNTNGSGSDWWGGGVPDDEMNTHAVAIEAGNDGSGEVWPTPQQAAYLVLVDALRAAYGISVNEVRHHREWAPDRKIDCAGPSWWATSGSWDYDAFRASLTASPGPPPPLPILEASDMLTRFTISDAANPVAVFVSNGIWYRHIPDETANDALAWFMNTAGLDHTTQECTVAQIGWAGTYIADDGTIGARNPWL